MVENSQAGQTPLGNQFDMWMRQIRVMEVYATEQGKKVGPEVAMAIAEAESELETVKALPPALDKDAARAVRSKAIQKILVAHGLLSEIVKPATPDSISFSTSVEAPDKGNRRLFLGVNFLLAIISLVAYGVGMAHGGVASGFQSWQGALELFGAGGVGASFYNLYWIHKYLVERTFDQQYCNTYYIRWALGLVAGFILGHLVPTNQTAPQALSPMLLAAIGGFAADAVNDILLRLTETVKTLIAGRGQEAIKAQQAAFDAEGSRIKLATQVQNARDLAALLAAAKASGAPDSVINRIQGLIDGALGTPPQTKT